MRSIIDDSTNDDYPGNVYNIFIYTNDTKNVVMTKINMIIGNSNEKLSWTKWYNGNIWDWNLSLQFYFDKVSECSKSFFHLTILYPNLNDLLWNWTITLLSHDITLNFDFYAVCDVLQLFISKHQNITIFVHFAVANGLRSTRITESPRRNILEINLSLLTGFDFFFPLPVFGTSVHISFTFSRTMLQCLKYTSINYSTIHKCGKIRSIYLKPC